MEPRGCNLKVQRWRWLAVYRDYYRARPWLQAADILAIESHVKIVCKILAARLIAPERRVTNESSEGCAAQVLLREIVTCLRRCLTCTVSSHHQLLDCPHLVSAPWLLICAERALHRAL
jgi:hypothetical protein